MADELDPQEPIPQDEPDEGSGLDLPQESDTPETPPEPSLVTVTISGQEYTVSPDIAEALQKREQQFQRKLSEQGAELGDLRRRVQPPAPAGGDPAPGQPTGPNYDVLLFESPSQALQSFRKEIVDEVVGMYQQQRSIDDFWVSFYTENPDLRGSEKAVKYVLQEDWEELRALPTSEAREALGKATRTWMHGAAKKLNLAPSPVTRTTLTPNRDKVESPSQTRGAAPATVPEELGSISDFLTRRRDQRRVVLTDRTKNRTT